MSSLADGFKPGLTAMTVATGVPHTRRPYDVGTAKQHAMSLELMRQKVQEGYKDPRIKARVAQILKAAGLDGRDRPSTRAVAAVILKHVQDVTIYMQDPPKTEWVQAPVVTLCLAPGLCIPAEDCDGLTVVFLTLTLAAGLTVSIVKADYAPLFGGSSPQSHVFGGVRDERGKWFFADPSTKNGLEDSVEGKLTWIDPLANAPIEIVGVGRMPVKYGMGDTPATTTTNTVQLPGTWTNVASNAVQVGLRYAVGVTLSGVTWTADDVAKFFATDFLVESTTPGQTATSWVMTGLARNTKTLTSSNASVAIVAVLQESVVAVSGPLVTRSPGVNKNPPLAISAGTAVVWGLGVAAAAGIIWEAHRKGHLK